MKWYDATERLPLLYDEGWRLLSELVLVEDRNGYYWTASLQAGGVGDEDLPMKWIQYGRDGYQYDPSYIKRWSPIIP